jgi:hypothetical protein
VNGVVVSVGAVALLAGSSWMLGSLVSARLAWSACLGYERAALRLTAGLGLTSLLLSILALAGWFAAATPVLAVLAIAGLVLGVRWGSDPGPMRVGPGFDEGRTLLKFLPPFWKGGTQFLPSVLVICAAMACLGALAPITDDDALDYVVPIARHIADSGALRVWPDQARSMYPQGHAVLMAWMLRVGSDRLGALTAFQWLLCLGVVSALARRVCARAGHVSTAIVLAIGAPVVAFQVASGKEDLFLAAATAATAFCLSGDGDRAELAAAGLFAGVAAAVKYSGMGVAIAAVAWVLIARRRDRIQGVAIVALCAAASGGLWYALNLWRFGNPIAPLMFGAAGTPYTPAIAREFFASGVDRTPLSFVIAPIWIFVDPSSFTGRGNLYNPLVYAGLLGLFTSGRRRRHGALFFAAGVLYVGWYFGLQNSRLLLPAAILLAPAAADVLVPLTDRHRFARIAGWTVVVASLGVVAAVGAVRVARYARDPATYLERETQHYADIEWMNAHLDPGRHRVASEFKVLAYLAVPSLCLDPSRQIEISEDEMADPARLLTALQRQRVTHLFVRPEIVPGLGSQVRVIHDNPASRLGGVRFFREPPTEPTAILEILEP